MMLYRHAPATLFLTGTLLCTSFAFAQPSSEKGPTIIGRVLDDTKKIPEATINVFTGNELAQSFTTAKSGRFSLDLPLGAEYTIEVLKEGYMQKRFAVDTKSDVPHDQETFADFPMDIHLIDSVRFEGIDNDVLDFPFALIKYSKRLKDFDHDPAYTKNMMRANAALMLISARAKNEE